MSIGILPWDKKPSEFLFESRTIDSFQPTTVNTEPANQSHCFPNYCSQFTLDKKVNRSGDLLLKERNSRLLQLLLSLIRGCNGK